MASFWIYFLGTVTAWYPMLVYGYLNVFMNHREVIKLMGLEVDLYYVHEGSVNSYAMRFTVPVPADMHELEFSWQSLTEYPLPYAITVELEPNQNTLAPPSLSIPERGFVPQQIESFFVYLPCTGNALGQVPFTVNMFVRGPPFANDTQLHFKRNKICLEGHFPSQNQSLAPAQASSQRPDLLGAAACALGVVVVLIIVISGMYVRAKKHIRQDSLHFTTTTYGSHYNGFIRLDPLERPPSATGSYATITSLNKCPLEGHKYGTFFERFHNSQEAIPYATALLPIGDQVPDTIYSKPDSICPSRESYYASSQITQLCEDPTLKNNRLNRGKIPDCASSVADSNKSNRTHKKIDGKEKYRLLPSIERSENHGQHLLNQGNYGRIYACQLNDSSDLLIKTVADGASLKQVACLLQEASILIGVTHRNILAPILANTELPGPPEIAYNYPSKGNLKIFLQKSRTLNTILSTRQVVEFSLHVTRGLLHLHSLGTLHKDIGTRNCYLDKDFNVKLCDGALSSDLFPHDYQCLGDNEHRPLRWLAIEVLQRNYYTTYSDIWMLGVLFWELSTLALTPFEELDVVELTTYLGKGFRLGQPTNCPNEFFTVMSCCWLEDPKQRPTLPQLLAYLQNFYDDLGSYS